MQPASSLPKHVRAAVNDDKFYQQRRHSSPQFGQSQQRHFKLAAQSSLAESSAGIGTGQQRSRLPSVAASQLDDAFRNFREQCNTPSATAATSHRPRLGSDSSSLPPKKMMISQQSFNLGDEQVLGLSRSRRSSLSSRRGSQQNRIQRADSMEFRSLIRQLRTITRTLPMDGDSKITATEEAVVKEQAAPVKRTNKELREMFHRATRLIFIMAKACVGMRKQAMAKSAVTALQLQWEKQQREATQLQSTMDKRKAAPSHFNFQVEDLMSTGDRFPDWAKEILSQPHRERKDGDLRCLHRRLTICIDYCEKFTPQMQSLLCQTGYYVTYENLRLILKEGHPGDAVYLILSGKVDVNRDVYDRTSGRPSEPVPTTVATLKAGASFGNEALIRRNTRNASIYAHGKVELLMVYREDFLNHNPDIFKTEFKQKLEIVRSMDLLKKWPADAQESLCVHSTLKEYKTGEVISRDTNEDQFIYLVAEGSVEVIHRLDVYSASHNFADEWERRRQEKEDTFPPWRMVEYMEEGLAAWRKAWVDLEPLYKTSAAQMPAPFQAFVQVAEEERQTPAARERAAQKAMDRKAWSDMEPLWSQSTAMQVPEQHAFIHIADLPAQSSCDLSSLNDNDAKPLILYASKGDVKVVRLPKISLMAFAPAKFLKQLNGPIGESICPETCVLFRCFLKHFSRKLYGKLVCNEIVARQASAGLSHIPATWKGTTGAARWPGARQTRPYVRPDSYGMDVGARAMSAQPTMRSSKSSPGYRAVSKRRTPAWSSVPSSRGMGSESGRREALDMGNEINKLALESAGQNGDGLAGRPRSQPALRSSRRRG